MKRQLLAWISIVVFFISTNGIVVYKHFCLSSNNKSVSLSELLCDEIEKADACCSSTTDHKDCCEVDFKFEKYNPSGKSELKSLSYKIAWEGIPLFPAEFIANLQSQYFEVLSVFPNPPNPNLHQPKTVSERLADIQAYLC